MTLSEIPFTLLILAERFQNFDSFGAYIFILKGSLKMEVTYFSEKLVSTLQIPRRRVKTVCRKNAAF